jgi:hypothetical protein
MNNISLLFLSFDSSCLKNKYIFKLKQEVEAKTKKIKRHFFFIKIQTRETMRKKIIHLTQLKLLQQQQKEKEKK